MSADPNRPPRTKKGHGGQQVKSLPRLSLAKKLLFSVVAIVLSFALLEGLLALVGVKPVLYQKDPYVGFASYIPLFVPKTEANGQVEMVTAKNKLRLFNAQEFPKTKPPGVFRIFSMGGSTTYGRPFNDATSFTGWLRDYLKALAPQRKWEVINAGGISYASYRVARLMEELIHDQPNLFIIYTGQNEFLEQRAFHKFKAIPEAALGVGSILSRSRVLTVVKDSLRDLLRSHRRPQQPQTILAGEVVTKLDNTVGPSAYHRDDRLKREILAEFRFNLGRMIDIAHSVGAKVLLVTPASNLRDCSPFKSQHRAGLSAAQLKRWNALYREGREAMTKDQNQLALADFDQATQIDDRYADLCFLRGRVLQALGHYAEAKQAYIHARDEDVCPLRALTPMRGIVEQVAKERDVPCVDFVAIQDARAPHGIPGREDFYDHVHPTIESHRLLALALIKAMRKEGWVKPDWDQATIQAVARKVKGRIDAKGEGLALTNLSKVLGWAGKFTEAYHLAVQAVKLDPDSPQTQYQAGLCAQILNHDAEAVGYYRRTVALAPATASAQGNLGVALEETGDLKGAIHHYQLAIRFGNTSGIARNERNLARARAKLRKSQEASSK